MAKKILSKKVVEGIRKMIAYVLANPEELDQDSYPYRGRPSCSMPFCAAGHIIRFTSPKKFRELMALDVVPDTVDWRREARGVMNLPNSPFIVSLFGFGEDWPAQFNSRYKKAQSLKTPKLRYRRTAEAFAARWQNLIDTDAKDLSTL